MVIEGDEEPWELSLDEEKEVAVPLKYPLIIFKMKSHPQFNVQRCPFNSATERDTDQ